MIIVNLIQVRLMKEINNMKTRKGQQFEQSTESRLIEAIIHKLQMNQFVSIVNLIQMRLTKVIHKMKNMMNQQFQ
jgi:hypothetical protein